MKTLICTLIMALLLVGCGSVEGDTSSEKSPAVTIVNEMSEAKSCTLKNGGSVYHDGGVFDDSELCGTVTEKCTDIQNKYEPLDEKRKRNGQKKKSQTELLYLLSWITVRMFICLRMTTM